MLPCFSALRLGRCRGRVRFAVLPSAPLNGVTSKLFPSVVETATGLAGSTLSNSSTGLSRISANEFPCRTSILIISGDSLYIHCITAQGIKRAEDVDLSKSITRKTGCKLDFFIITVLLLVIGILLFQRLHPNVSPAVSSSLKKSVAV